MKLKDDKLILNQQFHQITNDQQSGNDGNTVWSVTDLFSHSVLEDWADDQTSFVEVGEEAAVCWWGYSEELLLGGTDEHSGRTVQMDIVEQCVVAPTRQPEHTWWKCWKLFNLIVLRFCYLTVK